jgi:hypothetical protein
MMLLLSVVKMSPRPQLRDDRGYTLYLRTGRQRKDVDLGSRTAVWR